MTQPKTSPPSDGSGHTGTGTEPPFPVGWGFYCRDADECDPANGKHIHGDNASCVTYLRKFTDGRFADIRDDQCCACYFESFDWGEPVALEPWQGGEHDGADAQEHQ